MTIRRFLRSAAAVCLVLLAWSMILLALPFLGPAGRSVALIGDQSRIVTAVRVAGGNIIAVRGGTLVARSESPGFAAALYRAGAPLVLESRVASGCFGAV